MKKSNKLASIKKDLAHNQGLRMMKGLDTLNKEGVGGKILVSQERLKRRGIKAILDSKDAFFDFSCIRARKTYYFKDGTNTRMS